MEPVVGRELGKALGEGQGVAQGVRPLCPCFSAAAPMLDESVIIQLVEMGFPMDACRKAVYYTGNSGAEAAMNWVMSHMDDPGRQGWGAGAGEWGGGQGQHLPQTLEPLPSPDFANPLILPGSSGPGSTSAAADPPPEDCVTTIVSMGFSRDQALKALRATVWAPPAEDGSAGKMGAGVRFHPSGASEDSPCGLASLGLHP